MKNKIFYILILTIIVSCTNSRNDRAQANLKGEVWKVQEISYEGEEKSGQYVIGDKHFSGHTYWEFNTVGNLTIEKEFNKYGETESFSKYTYDKSDNCILAKNVLKRYDDSETTTLSKYAYDKSGNCILAETYEDNELTQKQVNVFDKNKIVEAKLFDDKGLLENIYKYDYKGKLTSSVKIYNKEGKVVYTIEYEHKSGLLNSVTTRDSANQINEITKYKRNKNNDVIELISTYQNSSKSRAVCNYEYDKQNNWIKKFLFDEKGKIETIIVRNIIYYTDSKISRKENDFIGMWFVVDDDDWFEFREDKKYDSGYSENISKSGSWEIDKKQKVLTLRANNPDDSRKYRYEFEGSQIILFTMQGEEEYRLEKK